MVIQVILECLVRQESLASLGLMVLKVTKVNLLVGLDQQEREVHVEKEACQLPLVAKETVVTLAHKGLGEVLVHLDHLGTMA